MTKKICLYLAIILLALQAGLLIYLAKTDSQTTDEAVHLYAGYTYVKYGDFRLNPEHPPLVKILSGLAVMSLKPNDPVTDINWQGNNSCQCDKTQDFFYDSWRENRSAGEHFLYESGNNASQILFMARLPVIVITLVLGIVIFVLVSRFWGTTSGLVALSLYVFNPTVAAHGHLVTTDLAVSLGVVLYGWALWDFWEKPSRKTTVWLGLALGLAELTKFTAIILIPISLAILIAGLIFKKWPISKGKIFGWYLLSWLIAWLVIWAGYGFPVTLAPATSSVVGMVTHANLTADYRSTAQKIVDVLYSVFRYFMVPREYFKGLLMVLGHTQTGQGSYLLGHTSNTGWWYYFPVLLVLKNSLAWLALVVAALWVTIKNQRRNWSLWYWLILGVGFLLFAIESKANLGVRHVLPVMVATSIWLGAIFSVSSPKIRLFILILLLWIIAQFIAATPNYLGYFNEIIGPQKGYLFARDSNLDWGQDVYRIRDYITKNNLYSPYLEYSWDGQAALKYYGVSYSSPESLNSSTQGWLVISPSALTDSKYTFLKGVKPFDYITPGALVYKLPASN